jgi:hypothetical protein
MIPPDESERMKGWAHYGIITGIRQGNVGKMKG